MSPEAIHLLRKSLAVIERHEEVAALIFYRRLFNEHPRSRALFGDDIRAQARKLTDMLALGVSLAEKPGALEAEMRALGARHVGYGVKDEHYTIIAGPLLAMLGEVLGDDFTPEVRAAWTEFYTAMAESAIRGAQAARSLDASQPAMTAATTRQEN